MRMHAQRAQLGGESGFTLIELLVVVLIIGVLAAIALPLFLTQGQKGHDAVAKSNARTLASLVEACHAGMSDYTQCDTESEVADQALDWGSGPGQVDVTAAAGITYTIVAVAETSSGVPPHVYTLRRLITGELERTCTTGTPGNNGGGCSNGEW